VDPLASRSLVGSEDPLRQGNRFLLLALLSTLILWNVPYGWIIIYPFKIFATWLHELSHGLLMLVTGAGLDRLEIFPDTSGMAMPKRGVPAFPQAVISCAGYMGTATWGAIFLILGRSTRGARLVLASLGAVLAFSALIWIRNAFGFAATIALATAMFAVSRFASESILAFLLNFLATQSCILAVLDPLRRQPLRQREALRPVRRQPRGQGRRRPVLAMGEHMARLVVRALLPGAALRTATASAVKI
jgi:hypothetical protein